jgi:predicted ATPase
MADEIDVTNPEARARVKAMVHQYAHGILERARTAKVVLKAGVKNITQPGDVWMKWERTDGRTLTLEIDGGAGRDTAERTRIEAALARIEQARNPKYASMAGELLDRAAGDLRSLLATEDNSG